MKKIRPIAIHLPQFHPTPENDAAWGKGFTEWTNVTKAKPLYKGHYQPHLPSDLGYYDLRLAEARLAQEALAKQFNIHGFCYYHYWFNGKRVLNEPVDRKLKNPNEDLPFMLCWANENWTKRWDGKNNEILLEQNYSIDDDVAHIQHLIPYFKDSRYIKVNGKQVFIVYKPLLIPDPIATVRKWREVALDNGIELYLCHCVFSHTKNWNRLIEGFDAVIDFEPFGIRRASVFSILSRKWQNRLISILKKSKTTIGIDSKSSKKNLNRLDYSYMTENIKPLKEFPFKLYPNLVPGWDNTSRRKNNPTLILDNSNPKLFKKWLDLLVADFEPYSEDENFLFINAWNEWAEGNHLEPDKKWGLQYLQAVKDSIEE